MSISFFLGQIIGIYLFFTSIALLINGKIYKKFFKDIVHNISLIIILGSINFTIGLILVISHNIWVADWELIITFIAYIVLIKGGWMLLFPTSIGKIVNRTKQKYNIDLASPIRWISWLWLIIGIYLIYLTFYRLPIDLIINI